MTDYEEMCAAFAASRKAYFDYRDRCFSHMGTLVKGFIDYCQIPKDQVRMVPCDKKPQEDSLYSIAGLCTSMRTPSGTWASRLLSSRNLTFFRSNPFSSCFA